MKMMRRMLARLPSLYRPEPDEDTLLNQLFSAVGGALETVENASGHVMRAHWVGESDRAAYHPLVGLRRDRAGLNPILPRAQVDVLDPVALASTLKEDTPLAIFIREQMSETDRNILEQSDVAAVALHRTLVAALEALVAGPSIYDDARFQDIELSDDLIALAGEDLEGRVLLDFNRRLLTSAYPELIAKPRRDHDLVHDLGRLGALVPLRPWTQPPAHRESVEAYRLRLARTVALYREGLGTLGALRRMIEASLPIRPDRPLEERDRPFLLEPFAPLQGPVQAVQIRGVPEHEIGPLMRWSFTAKGLREAEPVVYIKALPPAPDRMTAVNPLIERLDPIPLGLAFEGELEPDQTLRLRPAYTSWLGQSNGLRRHRALPTDAFQADPTAPGPWNTVNGTPDLDVRVLHQSEDRCLWLAGQVGDVAELWRFDSRNWLRVLEAQPHILALAEHDDALWIGTAQGLQRLSLYPAGDFVAEPVAALDGRRIQVLHREQNTWLIGTDTGLVRLDGDTAQDAGLPDISVHAVFDDDGVRFFGTTLGLFQYEPNAGRWHVYRGEAIDESAGDWAPYTPDQAPVENDLYLPPVKAVLRGPDSALWLGTDRGLARYLAKPVRGAAYQTRLEAFPDLIDAPIHTLARDARGQIWAGTERGLLRYDGRDWHQPRNQRWKQLGAADNLYQTTQIQPRGAWRFHRGQNRWERFQQDWTANDLDLRTTNRTAVYAILWTDAVSADLGSFDGDTFTVDQGVADNRLRMRIKPTPDRIIDGGLPAVPRISRGDSRWRYLHYLPEEGPEPPVDKRPAWTQEGRLIPPPQDAGTPWPGRYSLRNFDESVFSFDPAVHIWFAWDVAQPLTVVARLIDDPDQPYEPALLDRVWAGIQQVRPAGVRVLLAVDEHILRGE